VSAEQLNGFLRCVGADAELQQRIREADAAAAAVLAQDAGFDVTVGDLTRYKSRATTWRLSDRELAVVAVWQGADQPYWWQHVWAPEGVALEPEGAAPTSRECRRDGEESEHG
jgi:predicted ribosomally synthesized peptide with nif11-like leader